MEGTTGTKHQEDSKDREEEKKEHREPRPRNNKAWERKSCEQNIRAGRLTRGLGDSEAEKEEGWAVSTWDSSGKKKRKSKDRTQTESGRRAEHK